MSEQQRIAWDSAYRTRKELWSRAYDKWFDTDENDTVLDLGTGTGKSIIGIKGKIIGVDFSRKALTTARNRNPAVEAICCDACKLPFKDHYFDFARASFLFGHLNEEEIAETMDEIYRVLKFNGRLAIEVFSRYDGRFLRDIDIDDNTRTDGDGINHRYFDRNEIVDILFDFKIQYLKTVEWEQQVGPDERMKRSIIRALARKG